MTELITSPLTQMYSICRDRQPDKKIMDLNPRHTSLENVRTDHVGVRPMSSNTQACITYYNHTQQRQEARLGRTVRSVDRKHNLRLTSCIVIQENDGDSSQGSSGSQVHTTLENWDLQRRLRRSLEMVFHERRLRDSDMHPRPEVRGRSKEFTYR